MPIYPVIGKAAQWLTRGYAVVNGKNMALSKVYYVKDGVCCLCWDEGEQLSRTYEITCAEDLKKIREDPGGLYRVTADIAFDDDHKARDYLPLLPPDVPFTGILDGQGFAFGRRGTNIKPGYTTSYSVGIAAGETWGTDGYAGLLFHENRGIITRIRMSYHNDADEPWAGQWLLSSVSGDLVAGAGIAGINSGLIDQCETGYSKYENSRKVTMAVLNRGTIQDCDSRYGAAVVRNEGTIRRVLGESGNNVAIAVENAETGLITACLSALVTPGGGPGPITKTNLGRVENCSCRTYKSEDQMGSAVKAMGSAWSLVREGSGSTAVYKSCGLSYKNKVY